MSVIIVATDFSDAAGNATDYACNMAKVSGASLLMVHSFLIPVTFSDAPMPVMPMDEIRDIAEERLRETVQKYKATWPEVNMETKVLYGELTDSLQDYIQESHKKPWIIIMGNSESSGGGLFGSTIVATMKHLPCPVIAVPEHATFTQVKNICFACDVQNTSFTIPVNELSSLVAATGARLHVLSVNTDKRAPSEQQIISENTQVHNTLAHLNPEYHYETGTDTDQKIIDFVAGNQMDWLVVMPHRYSFFEGLFHKSHTKAIVRQCSIPIVALPSK
ncbi:universal stress protein [Chitinophagaceae bacterium MMS25-I14]